MFGIDGASPELVFGKWRKELPTISKLIRGGVHANLRAPIPPISITSWNVIFSGRDPSELGIFGYSVKTARGSRVITSKDIKTPRVWNILSKQKMRSVVLYVPLTYPAEKINGAMVADFLTPSIKSNCAYPASIKAEIKKLGDPELFFDVAVGLAGHKGLEPADLIRKTYKMTDMQTKLAAGLLEKEDWDLFIMTIVGSDRLQHMLWRHFDKNHRNYIRNSPHKNALLDYYRYLDKHLGKFIKKLPQNTHVIFLSDHGMVRQEGKININNWLMREGYLRLKPEYKKTLGASKMRFSADMVDPKKSTAYASGAYHARIFINKKLAGRRYKSLQKELIRKIKAIPDDHGGKMETRVFKAGDIYKNPRHPECPDLTVYFDDLRWASNPDFTGKGLYSFESAAGADSAGHSREGVFVLSRPAAKNKKNACKIDAARVAPTILKLLGAKIPSSIKAKPLI